MDIRQIKYFNTIVEEGTITAAAKKLHMTQPPLTAQMRQLEKELKCELFIREGRRIHLSEAGEHFYGKSKNVMELCDRLLHEMQDFHEGVLGTLRLGIISSVQGSLFFQWISEYQKLYKDVKYDICNENTYVLLDKLNSGLIDLAIIRTPFSANGYDRLTLRKEPMVAIGTSDYLSGNKEQEISIPKLCEMPLIIYRRWEKILSHEFEAAGCEPVIRCYNDNAQMTVNFAEAGFGVGIVPSSVLLDIKNNALEYRTIASKSLHSDIVLICKNKKYLPESAKLFWKLLEDNNSN